MRTELSAENQAYLDLFHEPRISAYEFFKIFFALLYKKNQMVIDRDFTEFLYKKKKDSKYSEILKEIKFRNNGIYIYSNQIEDSIFTLQNDGLIGKKNPSFGKITIEYDNLLADDILEKFSDDDKATIQSIIDEMEL